MSRRPIIRVTAKVANQNHSVLSVWPPDRIPGMYSVSLDKGTEKYPPINFLTLLKAFAGGGVFINVSVESEREQRNGGGQPQGGNGGGFGDDAYPPGSNDFGDDPPF